MADGRDVMHGWGSHLWLYVVSARAVRHIAFRRYDGWWTRCGALLAEILDSTASARPCGKCA